MESKDLPPAGDSPSLRTRSKLASLQLDVSRFQLPPDAEDNPTSVAPGPSTPTSGGSSSAALSPTGGRPRSMTQGSALPGSSQSRTSVLRNRSATVANPPKSTPLSGAPPEKEKRKRSRVTPEQLTHLERIFALDRSPTAAKRKEISEMLGMQERQTQIWFQNRRAKAKTLEGKGKISLRGSPPSGADSPPDTPPDYHVGLDVDLQTLIHEDESVNIIPCSDLSIGSWRRISSTLGQHDLVAYISPSKRCLTWFIHSNGYGFKMEIPFDIIASTNLTASVSPGQGLASFYLSRPPYFYLETMASPAGGVGNVKTWKKCADWTEGQQASKVLRHDLIGAAIPLAAALKGLPSGEHVTALPASAPLATSAYHHTESMQGMHIPQPPMAGLEPPPGFGLSVATPSHLLHGRKRSFSGPAALSQSAQGMSEIALLGGPQAEPPAAQSSSFSPFASRAGVMPFQADYTASLFRPFPQVLPGPAPGSHEVHSSSLTDFSTVPISHAIAPRPYSASSANTRFPFESQVPPHVFETSATTTPSLLTSAFNPSRIRQDIQMAPVDSVADEQETSRFGGNDASARSASHEQPFEAALGMESHDPHPQ